MPDAGDFDRRGDARAPGDWASALSALPLDAPDAHGWQRVQARLPPATPAPRARWQWWLATAASLALAVAIPVRMQPEPGAGPASDVAPSPATKSLDTPVGSRDVRVLDVEADMVPRAMSPAASTNPDMPPTTQATREPPERESAIPPSQRPIRIPAQPESIRIADADGAADLEPLYAQSAQLESLLAMARDERVASGTVAALTDRLDTKVARIDAALIQPGLPAERRTELWGERVDTLRQLVGVEATQRLLAARGLQYDAALVRID